MSGNVTWSPDCTGYAEVARSSGEYYTPAMASRSEPPKRYWTNDDRPRSRLANLGGAALLVVGVVLGGFVLIVVLFLLIYGW